MKKVLLFIIIGICSALMFGCQSDGEKALTDKPATQNLQNSTDKQYAKLKMYTEKSAYTESTDIITLQIKNPEANNYEFGEYYTIEKYQDNVWSKLQFKKDTGFNDILYILKPGKIHTQKIYLQGLDYKITKGKYRIIKEFSSNGNKITLTAEFNIV